MHFFAQNIVIIMKLNHNHIYLPSVVNVGWFEDSTEIMVGRVDIDIEDSIWKQRNKMHIRKWQFHGFIWKLLFFLSNIKKNLLSSCTKV